MPVETLASSKEHSDLALIRGFEHVKRYWDSHIGSFVAKILPGEFYVSMHNEYIATVLGSCVSACIRDVENGVGGMNHFMLPIQTNFSDNWGNSAVCNSTRYGNWAMEHLINEIIKYGGKKERLEIKIVGGGRVLSHVTDIGERNIQFVTEYLREEGLEAAAQDVGDVYPRKVLYQPETGKVKVKKLRNARNDTIERLEKQYSASIQEHAQNSDIELFQ